MLTVIVAATGSELRFTGILRSYYSASSFCGWALIPPQQHGGFDSVRLTALNLDQHEDRRRIVDERGTRLRYVSREAVFELERDHAPFTGPPRPRAPVTAKRYHQVGGRRKTVPERWLLE